MPSYYLLENGTDRYLMEDGFLYLQEQDNTEVTPGVASVLYVGFAAVIAISNNVAAAPFTKCHPV